MSKEIPGSYGPVVPETRSKLDTVVTRLRSIGADEDEVGAVIAAYAGDEDGLLRLIACGANDLRAEIAAIREEFKFHTTLPELTAEPKEATGGDPDRSSVRGGKSGAGGGTSRAPRGGSTGSRSSVRR